MVFALSLLTAFFVFFDDFGSFIREGRGLSVWLLLCLLLEAYVSVAYPLLFWLPETLFFLCICILLHQCQLLTAVGADVRILRRFGLLLGRLLR